MSGPGKQTTTWLIALLIATNAAFILRDIFQKGTANADELAAAVDGVVRGDANGDGAVDMKDAVNLIDHLVKGDPLPEPGVNLTLTREHLEILGHMRIVYLDDGRGNRMKTIRLEGCNLQIVNGLAATNGDPERPELEGPSTSNGLGNLIVGYQELRKDGGNVRTGSHNLVIGSENNYGDCGGLVVGRRNEIQGPYSTVSGGTGNRAAAPYASVSGGEGNVATGPSSSISGGRENIARGFDTSVSGGLANIADGISASVSGGFQNMSRGNAASISGGYSNVADGDFSVVSGGYAGRARGNGSSIGGGKDELTRSAYEHQPDHAQEIEDAIELAAREARLRQPQN